jgi:hypothetical protein
MQYPPWH